MAPAQPAHNRRTRLSSLGDLTEGNEKVRTSDITMDARLYHLNGNQSDLLQEVNDLIWVENKDLDDNPNKLAPVWNGGI